MRKAEFHRRLGEENICSSVQAALDRVRLAGLPAFPETSTDPKRTFVLNFKPTDKLGSG